MFIWKVELFWELSWVASSAFPWRVAMESLKEQTRRAETCSLNEKHQVAADVIDFSYLFFLP